MLMILDGYGLNDSLRGNAIAAARKPNLDHIFQTYPMTRLAAGGSAVGLPEGQMGNSEVGHLNIGAGRIVYQELTKITKTIEDHSFFDNIVLNQAIGHVLENCQKGGNNALHLMGLLSDGGVHSHISHLFALIDLAKLRGVQKVYIHCFTDGRDVPPNSGIHYMEELEAYLQKAGIGQISTVSGRYYAMDRDKRWDRVEAAYAALTAGEGRKATGGTEAVRTAYEKGETDEFIFPSVCTPDGQIQDGDSIIFFNFRPDRAREITRALIDPAFDGFPRKKTIRGLTYVCMTQYDENMTGVKVAFPPQLLNNTLGEYLSQLGLHQLRIAETEKYAHVTFFFNGGVEKPNPLEDRILIPSPKVATYDLQPEMSAYQVTDRVLKEIDSRQYDIIILNFANADMVGHTGVFAATVKAIEAVDRCVSRIVPRVLEQGGQILLTADHGNADTMLDAAGNPITSHSTNPVPLVHIARKPVASFRPGGKLADIAPTLLTLMNLPVPTEMTGTNLAIFDDDFQ